MMKKHAALALVLAFVVCTPGFSQSPSPTPNVSPVTQAPAKTEQEVGDVVRITSNLVQVDAVVTDRSGNNITDLKPDEVQIFEDGRQQKISHFSYIGAPASKTEELSTSTPKVRNLPQPPVVLKPQDVRRTIAIVVDDLGLSFESLHLVREALKKFVDEQMQPGDLAAIIRTSGGIGALQQFTMDKRQLYAAIEQIKWYAGGRAAVGAFAPMGSDNLSGAPADAQYVYDDLEQFREELFTVGTLGAIDYVVRGLRELPGRKSVVLLSDGIKLLNRIDMNRQQNSRVPNSASNVRSRVLDAVEKLIDLANRASVVIYTIDARGLQPLQLIAADNTSPPAGQSVVLPSEMQARILGRRNSFMEGQDGLNYLAQQTGGFFIHDTNDVGGGIRRALNDQSGYYLVGYRPDESTFDATGRRKFHHLSIKVTRPGKYTVRMRNGFFGIANAEAAPSPLSARDQIVKALTSPFASSDIHLQLTSLFGNDAKVGSFMRSMLHVDAHDLTFADAGDGWHEATFDVVGVTFGDNGTVVDEISRTDTFRVNADRYQDVLKYGFMYMVGLPIKKPGAYQLRTVLRDHNSQRVGSAAQFVEVPDLKKDRLALSGLMMKGVNKEGAPSDPDAGESVRRLKTGMSLRYGFVIYNARFDKTTRKPQLQIQARLFRNGQIAFEGKVQPFALNDPPDLTRLSADGSITLGADLGPAEYVLQVIVTDRLADEKHRTAIQWMNFEIVK